MNLAEVFSPKVRAAIYAISVMLAPAYAVIEGNTTLHWGVSAAYAAWNGLVGVMAFTNTPPTPLQGFFFPKMARTKKPVTAQELVNLVSQAMRETVINPTIAAYKPQEYQEKFHASKAQGKLFIGGNRSGKTVAGAAEAVMRATGRHPREDLKRPPTRGRIVAVDFDNGVEKIVKPEIQKWMPPSSLINQSWEDSYNRSLRTLTLANGSTIEFMSYDQDVDKFAGTSRDWVWFDEEPPEDIFNECMLRLADVDGDWWLTMTPLIDASWTLDRLYEPYLGKTGEYIEVFEVETTQNKYVNEQALERVLVGMSEEQRAARTKGQYFTYGGLVYKGSFNANRHIIPDIVATDEWLNYRSSWGHFRMLDHGYRNPTAVLFGCYDEEGRIIIYDEIYQTGKLVHENAKDILAHTERLGIVPEYTVGDPSIANKDPITGTSIHMEYAEHGVFISLGNNDVRGGIARVQGRFAKDLLFVSERCEKTLWELTRYRWDKYASAKIAAKKSAKETPVKNHDHAMDALRYGVASRPTFDPEIDEPVGNVLNLPTALSEEMDWEAIVANENNSQVEEYFI